MSEDMIPVEDEAHRQWRELHEEYLRAVERQLQKDIALGEEMRRCVTRLVDSIHRDRDRAAGRDGTRANPIDVTPDKPTPKPADSVWGTVVLTIYWREVYWLAGVIIVVALSGLAGFLMAP